jgi:F-type H+-transporting ATPase subunit epsilon
MANEANEQERAGRLDLEIVTPKGRALKVIADEVTAPSVQGEFGVLPGHLPLLAALQTGIVTYRQGGETKRCAVGRGFAEAGPTKVAILTDRYIEREQVDPVAVGKELTEIQAQLAKVEAASIGPLQDNAELAVLIQEENWLAAKLELYGLPAPATMRPFETFGPVPDPDASDVPREDAERASDADQGS